MWSHKHRDHNIEFPKESKIKTQATAEQERWFIVQYFISENKSFIIVQETLEFELKVYLKVTMNFGILSH